MKRIFVLSFVAALSMLVGVTTAFACDGDKSAETTASIDAPAETTLVTLRIEDANCGSCVLPIREQLTTLTGVFKVEGSESDYKDILVTLTGKVSNDDLIAAVKKAGYTASIKAPKAEKKNS